MSFAWTSTKLRAMERHQPSPPLSSRKGEGNRLVLLVAGPAVSIFVKRYVFLELVVVKKWHASSRARYHEVVNYVPFCMQSSMDSVSEGDSPYSHGLDICHYALLPWQRPHDLVGIEIPAVSKVRNRRV